MVHGTEIDEYTQLALYRTTYQAARVNMADICSHTRCTTNIVKAERGYKRISFEEQRERLANSATGTKHSNFRLPWGARGEGTGLVGQKAGDGAGVHRYCSVCWQENHRACRATNEPSQVSEFDHNTQFPGTFLSLEPT